MKSSMASGALVLLLALAPGTRATAGVAATAAQAATTAVEPVSSATWLARYAERYKRDWGVEIVGVRPVSSGYMLRFSYRVIDPAKAAPLFDERTKPYLYDGATGARMAVPAMENIGELRQTPRPVADRTYFIIFGNPGKLVQSGGRVKIVIGKFEIDGLVVD
jgi:hypothetical protein